MLELRVLDGDPLLDLLTLLCLASDLLDVVQLRHWLLRLLRGLELLVLLDDGISLLELGQLILNLVLGEGEPPNDVEEGHDLLRCQVQL